MGRRLLGTVTALLAAIALAVACGDTSHVYEGRLFVADRGCLGTTASVDVVDGERPASPCPEACLVQPLADGGRAVYVATMCAPYPFGFDTTGSDPVCPRALAAHERGDTCLADGGSSRPAPRDSGAD